jgi:CRISPR-associated endonuclease/helicase Cas3
MKEKIQSLLKELWAKDDGTTIREHTDKLLENLEKLKAYYRDEVKALIPKSVSFELKERFWEILELACEYHDYGKIHSKFQAMIGNKNIKPMKDLPDVRHNLLSPVFVNVEDELIRKIVRLLVLHHHPVEVERISLESVEMVLRKEFKLEKNPIRFMLRKTEKDYLRDDVATMFKIPADGLIQYYRLLKGLLLRIDHASSSKRAKEVEDVPPEDVLSFVDEFFRQKGKFLNEMQTFVRDNRDRSLAVIAPTGAGKTEAGFIYLQKKGFFMLPYRVSANGIYMRAERLLGNYAGLLHSSALSYVLEREENKEDIQNNKEDTAFLNYFLSCNFAKPIIISTPDQLMHFVFRYKGFEKYYATALYSRLVIDELQSYDPITLAFIVQGLEVLAQNGGKFLVMTATFPEFLREKV